MKNNFTKLTMVIIIISIVTTMQIFAKPPKVFDYTKETLLKIGMTLPEAQKNYKDSLFITSTKIEQRTVYYYYSTKATRPFLGNTPTLCMPVVKDNKILLIMIVFPNDGCLADIEQKLEKTLKPRNSNGTTKYIMKDGTILMLNYQADGAAVSSITIN